MHFFHPKAIVGTLPLALCLSLFPIRKTQFKICSQNALLNFASGAILATSFPNRTSG
jgi:hypothetical protein